MVYRLNRYLVLIITGLRVPTLLFISILNYFSSILITIQKCLIFVFFQVYIPHEYRSVYLCLVTLNFKSMLCVYVQYVTTIKYIIIRGYANNTIVINVSTWQWKSTCSFERFIWFIKNTTKFNERAYECCVEKIHRIKISCILIIPMPKHTLITACSSR